MLKPANVFDYTDFEIYSLNDTHSYFNGTWKFNRELNNPWKYHFYTETYTRGKWLIQAADSVIPDLCEKMHDPFKPWYEIYKHLEPCPRPAGV